MTEGIQELIDRLRELDKKASPAPWESSNHGEGKNTFLESEIDNVLVHDERGSGHVREDIAWINEANASMIVEARNALPDLLDEIERLQESCDLVQATAASAWAEGFHEAVMRSAPPWFDRGKNTSSVYCLEQPLQGERQ